LKQRRRLVLAYPGDLCTRTGGYIYDRRLALELEARGWDVDRLSLPPSFPFPAEADLDHVGHRLASIPTGTTVLVDGLALGAMPAIAAAAARRVDLVGLVHHPLCLETGLDPVRAAALAESERAALAAARAVIVTSRATAAALVKLMDVPAERIAIAVPGTDPSPVARGSTNGKVRMLSVGTVTPRKGHEVLVRALVRVHGPWKLIIAGSLDRDPATAERLRKTILAAGTVDRIQLLGELSETALGELYDQADLFVSASFHEGYGMAIAEALARGLPVVAASGGAVADTVPADAGLLVASGDAAALGSALQRFLSDPGLADRLRQGASTARKGLPRWADTAACVEQAILRIAA
jgi:glycosyltransferase involved in cell wall biosynthesis